MLNIVCVEHGNYAGHGRAYVNILHDMVKRSIEPGTFRFVCFTDNREDLHPDIIVRDIPEGLAGWWCKLYLFAPGVFDDGDRVLFIDLDTVVMGGIGELAKYDGEFCILRDFYRPTGYGSGLMAWRAGNPKLEAIWESFDATGRRPVAGGDQAWIEQCINDADLWQVVYPGRVVSYKQHVLGHEGVPVGSWIVCFHGEPKPHNCDHELMARFWKIGGSVIALARLHANTPEQTILDQVRANVERGDVGWMLPGAANGDHMCIVGGGPSLADTYRSLRGRRKRGQHIWAMNAVHDYLIERNIVPDVACVIDARQDNAEFVKNPHPDVTYYIAARCHPDVFDALKGHRVRMFFTFDPGVPELLKDIIGETRPYGLIAGGPTVALKSMFLGYMLGYRQFHCYGLDSSYRDGENHAYRQPLNDGERIENVVAEGQEFVCARWMIAQAESWQDQWKTLTGKGCTVTAHGDGLIPMMYRTLTSRQRKAA